MTRFALRGAIGFGLTALIAFSLAVLYARTAPLLQADYFMVAGLICGVAGGLAYGRRWGLPLVFGVNLGLVAYLFGLQDARLVSPSDVLYTGLATAFVFWLVGGCAVLALYFPRYALPLDLMNSISPASVAADWLWSWGLVGVIIGTIGLWRRGRILAVIGIGVAVALLFGSFRILENPWKTRFNSNYASKLLREHADSSAAIYTGNLVLAQAALDPDDIANARRYLLEAATTTAIQEKAPDFSVARILLDRGERDTVLEY